MKQYNISVYPKSFKGVTKCDIPSKIINKSIASHRESVTLKELAELIEKNMSGLQRHSLTAKKERKMWSQCSCSP